MEGYEANTTCGDRKRLCKRYPVEELNILMWEWFQNMMKQGIRVSGPIVQEKALLFARELQIPETEFKASKGWLNRFRDRHNISFQTVCGESGSVSPETVTEWKEKLPEIVAGHEPRDVYNLDETGLYFRAMPDKTLHVSGEKASGGKKSKDRITVMLCVNMTGDFEKPLIIGKAQRPRCFRNVNLDSLPVTWEWNKKAWMTSGIFTKWLTDFNKKMRREGRHVILFLDNATSHPDDLRLSSVKIQFLPKNTTSVLQPLDQGILQNMKVLYRKRLIRSVLSKIENDETLNADTVSKSVNLMDAVRFVKSSVGEIKKETVTRCFVKAGFCMPDSSSCEEFKDDNVPLAELVELMRKSKDKITTVDSMSVTEYVGIDSDTCVHEELASYWESQMIEKMRQESSNDLQVPDSDEEEEPSGSLCKVAPAIKSHQEALGCIESLRMYCMSKGLTSVSELFERAEDLIEKETVKALSCSKQVTLDKFFVR